MTAAQPGPPDPVRPIEGVILVKFAPDALETPLQQLRPNELGLSRGTYFVRVEGETFAATERLTVVR